MAERRPQSRQQQPEGGPDGALVAAVATLMAVNATPKPTASKIATVLALPVVAVFPVLLIARSRVIPQPTGTPADATPQGEAARSEVFYRAAYVVAGSRRWAAGLRAGRSEDELRAAEQRWFKQHMDATKRRRMVAAQVAQQQAKHGNRLGWYAKLDDKTTPECRAAHGKNFDPTRRPAIGYPGSVHPNCRCKAGTPHATRQTVYGIRPDRKAA